jgi:hypothetical protein
MVTPDQDIPLAKLALVIAKESSEGGDYLKTRDELFEGETVESLAAKIRTFREQGQ